MTDPLSLTLPASPTGSAGLAVGSMGGVAGDGAPAASGFDALLSAQLVAAAPQNPADTAASIPSPPLAAVAVATAVIAPPAPGVAGPLGQMSLAAAPLAQAPQTPVPAAIGVAPGLAPVGRARAEAPAPLSAADSPVAAPVTVAGKLPETGKPLPAGLPRTAKAIAQPAAETGTASKNDTSVASGEDPEEPEGTGERNVALPATDLPVTVPVLPALAPALAMVAAPVVAAAIRTDRPLAACANIPARAAATALDTPAPQRRIPATPETARGSAAAVSTLAVATVADSTVAPARTEPLPASLTSPAVVAAPASGSRQPLVSGIAITIADAQPALVPVAARPAVTVAAAVPNASGREAPTRSSDYALSFSPSASLASAVAAIEGKSAAPGGQGEVGHGQPPMADPSLTSPAGPSPVVSPEATRGPATLFPQPVMPVTAALPQVVAVAPAAQDMSALVDRLVEARAAARSSASPTIVTTAVRHAEFGSVSLRFDTAGDNLSVTMASNDPGFAPAAQAALASQVAPATASADASTQQNPQRQHAPEQPGTFQAGNAATGGFTQSQSQSQHQQPQGQPGFAAAGRQQARPANPSTGADTATDPSTHQSGVFA